MMRYPINVVVLRDDGMAENRGCAGPDQIREWAREGAVNMDSGVFVVKDNDWLTVRTYLLWCEKRTDDERLEEMDATLTNLVNVAQQLKAISGGFESVGDRNISKRREVIRSNGESDHSDDNHVSSVFRAVTGVGTH